MRTYTWDEYYEKFYDWADSTRSRYLSNLTSLGPAEEVAELIIEFDENTKAANQLLAKAVEANLKFSGEELIQISWTCDETLLTQAVKNSASRLTAGDLEDLELSVDYKVIDEIRKMNHIPDPDEEEYEESYAETKSAIYSKHKAVEEHKMAPQKKTKKPGLGTFLAALFLAAAGVNSRRRGRHRHRHTGRCNGDCANCPPHYGYRYGRWYYGRGHVRGCQFGGNGGR